MGCKWLCVEGSGGGKGRFLTYYSWGICFLQRSGHLGWVIRGWIFLASVHWFRVRPMLCGIPSSELDHFGWGSIQVWEVCVQILTLSLLCFCACFCEFTQIYKAVFWNNYYPWWVRESVKAWKIIVYTRAQGLIWNLYIITYFAVVLYSHLKTSLGQFKLVLSKGGGGNQGCSCIFCVQNWSVIGFIFSNIQPYTLHKGY